MEGRVLAPQILAGRLCMPAGIACCSRSEFQSQIDIPGHCSPDRGHRTFPWHPSRGQTPHRPHRCGGDLAFPPESTIAVCGIGTWVVVAGGVGSFANSARSRSESSLLFREYDWTLGVVDGESILPKLGCSFCRMRLGARSMDELEDADEPSNPIFGES